MRLLISLITLILAGGAAGVLIGLGLDAVRPDTPDWLRTVVIGFVAGGIAGGGAAMITNRAARHTEV
jgi:uncharacterized protein involved in exopolysaccharide biosynthesis